MRLVPAGQVRHLLPALDGRGPARRRRGRRAAVRPGRPVRDDRQRAGVRADAARTPRTWSPRPSRVRTALSPPRRAAGARAGPASHWSAFRGLLYGTGLLQGGALLPAPDGASDLWALVRRRLARRRGRQLDRPRRRTWSRWPLLVDAAARQGVAGRRPAAAAGRAAGRARRLPAAGPAGRRAARCASSAPLRTPCSRRSPARWRPAGWARPWPAWLLPLALWTGGRALGVGGPPLDRGGPGWPGCCSRSWSRSCPAPGCSPLWPVPARSALWRRRDRGRPGCGWWSCWRSRRSLLLPWTSHLLHDRAALLLEAGAPSAALADRAPAGLARRRRQPRRSGRPAGLGHGAAAAGRARRPAARRPAARGGRPRGRSTLAGLARRAGVGRPGRRASRRSAPRSRCGRGRPPRWSAPGWSPPRALGADGSRARLRSYRFGWRQPVAAVLGAARAAGPGRARARRGWSAARARCSPSVRRTCSRRSSRSPRSRAARPRTLVLQAPRRGRGVRAGPGEGRQLGRRRGGAARRSSRAAWTAPCRRCCPGPGTSPRRRSWSRTRSGSCVLDAPVDPVVERRLDGTPGPAAGQLGARRARSGEVVPAGCGSSCCGRRRPGHGAGRPRRADDRRRHAPVPPVQGTGRAASVDRDTAAGRGRRPGLAGDRRTASRWSGRTVDGWAQAFALPASATHVDVTYVDDRGRWLLGPGRAGLRRAAAGPAVVAPARRRRSTTPARTDAAAARAGTAGRAPATAPGQPTASPAAGARGGPVKPPHPGPDAARPPAWSWSPRCWSRGVRSRAGPRRGPLPGRPATIPVTDSVLVCPAVAGADDADHQRRLGLVAGDAPGTIEIRVAGRLGDRRQAARQARAGRVGRALRRDRRVPGRCRCSCTRPATAPAACPHRWSPGSPPGCRRSVSRAPVHASRPGDTWLVGGSTVSGRRDVVYLTNADQAPGRGRRLGLRPRRACRRRRTSQGVTVGPARPGAAGPRRARSRHWPPPPSWCTSGPAGSPRRCRTRPRWARRPGGVDWVPPSTPPAARQVVDRDPRRGRRPAPRCELLVARRAGRHGRRPVRDRRRHAVAGWTLARERDSNVPAGRLLARRPRQGRRAGPVQRCWSTPTSRWSPGCRPPEGGKGKFTDIDLGRRQPRTSSVVRWSRRGSTAPATVSTARAADGRRRAGHRRTGDHPQLDRRRGRLDGVHRPGRAGSSRSRRARSTLGAGVGAGRGAARAPTSWSAGTPSSSARTAR